MNNHINAGDNAVVLLYENGKKGHCMFCGHPVGESWSKLQDHCGRYHSKERQIGWLTWNMDWNWLMWRNPAAVRAGAGAVCAVIPVMWKQWLKNSCSYYQPANPAQAERDLKGEATKALQTFKKLRIEAGGPLFYGGHSS